MLADLANYHQKASDLALLDDQVALYLKEFSNADARTTRAARAWQLARLERAEHLFTRLLRDAARSAFARLSEQASLVR